MGIEEHHVRREKKSNAYTKKFTQL